MDPELKRALRASTQAAHQLRRRLTALRQAVRRGDKTAIVAAAKRLVGSRHRQGRS